MSEEKEWAIEYTVEKEDCCFIMAKTKKEAIEKFKFDYPDAQIDSVEEET